MIEEPYRWVEAIRNRREYIEDQLAPGSPIVLLPCVEGLLLMTVTGDTRKVFEIYDRIAFAAVGHPADIERMRLAAIDLAHVEGFNRSVNDVSLRRLVNFGLSPALKNAFEQIFSAPFIVKMLLAEIGADVDHDFIVKLDYDGSYGRSDGTAKHSGEVVAGSKEAEEAMLAFLKKQTADSKRDVAAALQLGARTWAVGMNRASQSAVQAAEERQEQEILADTEAVKILKEHLKSRHIEAALLDRRSEKAAKFRMLDDKETRAALKDL